MTVYSYFCAVFLGDGEQDTLVCSVDGDPREPCKFPNAKHEKRFRSSIFVKVDIIVLQNCSIVVNAQNFIHISRKHACLNIKHYQPHAGLLEDSINVFDFEPGVHTATITVTDTLGSSDSESFDFTTPEPLGQYNGTMDIIV